MFKLASILIFSGSSLPCAPKTREVRRSRNASRCSAPGSNSSSVLKRSLWAVIHSEHMNGIHLGVGCRGGGERLLLLAPVHTSSIPRREPRLGISIQFCRVPPQIFYLLPPAACVDRYTIDDIQLYDCSSSSGALARSRDNGAAGQILYPCLLGQPPTDVNV